MGQNEQNSTAYEVALGSDGKTIVERLTGRPLRQRGGAHPTVPERKDARARRLADRIKDYETLPRELKERGAYHKPGGIRAR
jgi:hypothetical protein